MGGPPDVYLFVVDSLREDVVSYDPDDPGITTNFADFAADSAVFDTAITNGIGTAPAMTAMLTGTLPLSHGGHWWIDEDRTTIAEALDRAGYETTAIHTNPNVSRLRNFDKGFDTFDESLLPPLPGSMVRRLPDTLLRGLNKAQRVLRRRPYLSAERLRRKIGRWLDESTSPRFLWTQFMDVHGPYLSHEGFSYSDKVRAERLWRKAAVTDPEGVTEDEHGELWSRYRAEVAHWDGEFGRLLDELRRRDSLEDSLVVVTSDHGEEFREHGAYGHGNNAYEELARVPLILSFPSGRFAGRRVSHPVRLVDVVPTILDVTGLARGSFGTDLVGASLVPLLKGAADPAAYRPALVEKEVRGTDDFRFAVRTDDWKFIDDRHEGRTELYDLGADPDETENLVEAEPEIVAELRAVVEARTAKLGERQHRAAGAESEAVRERLERLGYVE